ncbi:HTH_Tnp_Tc3_2 domain-containing protein [Trichonephila clavipes]|uniref:HTH_Tnp_Tc3_2 domain-containing protein n=1 Tax=Trichonephila clavipes TaxID=2585209 RepID=A0A8X6SW81_TRICX|nr:HTH_Tnp_Tc3_2 domain-containing protein [Trichonephila clavipes]
MASRHYLEDATRWPIDERFQGGQSQAICCRCVVVLRNAVLILWKQFTETGTVVRRPDQDRKTATTLAQDRYLRLLFKRVRSARATHLSHVLYNTTGLFILRIMVPQRLNEGYVNARHLVVSIHLNVNHKKGPSSMVLKTPVSVRG